MKRFRFSLQPIAILRAHAEAQAQEAFAAAVQRRAAAEQELAATRGRVTAIESTLRQHRQERHAAAAAVYLTAGYSRECAAERAAEEALAAAGAQMEQRRHEFLDAHRRLEVVRRLEQKARAAHRAAQFAEEQGAFDDLSGGRSARRASAARGFGPAFQP